MFGIELNVLLVAFLAALGVSGLIYAVFFNTIDRKSNLDRRLRNLQHTGVVKSSQGALNQDLERFKKRRSIQGKLKKLNEKQKKINKKPDLQELISQAGLQISVTQFFTYSLVSGICFTVVAFAITGSGLLTLTAFIIGSIFVPQLLLRQTRKRRLNRFIMEFPDAIDVIIRGVKSGLPINDCLVMVSREAREPVASEIRRIIEYQHLGEPLSEAILRLNQNIPTAESNFFGIVISIQQASGGNLSEALSNLSSVLRDRKKLNAKVKAMSAEAKASSMIIGSLPFIVTFLLYIMSPSYIMILFTESAGNMILLVSLVWIGLGIFVMKQMINFDF